MKELVLAVLMLAGTGAGFMIVSGHGSDLKEAITGAVPADIRSASEDVRSYIPSDELERPDPAVAAEHSDAGPAQASTKVIGHTDGIGVSLRSDCADAARIDGSLPDGTVVSVTEHGSGRCAAWSLVAADGVTTWVRNRYLVAPPAANPVKNNDGSGDRPQDAEPQDESDGNRLDGGRAHPAVEPSAQPPGTAPD